MSRAVAAVLLAAVVSSVATIAWVSPASAQGNKVVCTQVSQRPGQLDEAFVANFMSEQIGAGRERFQTVSGLSTVLCAW